MNQNIFFLHPCTPFNVDWKSLFTRKEQRMLLLVVNVSEDEIAGSDIRDWSMHELATHLFIQHARYFLVNNFCAQNVLLYHHVVYNFITLHWMGYWGVEIIDFPLRNGLLCLGNSYDNIEWGPGKIIVFKMSPSIV